VTVKKTSHCPEAFCYHWFFRVVVVVDACVTGPQIFYIQTAIASLLLILKILDFVDVKVVLLLLSNSTKNIPILIQINDC
jgi:hypothetical protein